MLSYPHTTPFPHSSVIRPLLGGDEHPPPSQRCITPPHLRAHRYTPTIPYTSTHRTHISALTPPSFRPIAVFYGDMVWCIPYGKSMSHYTKAGGCRWRIQQPHPRNKVQPDRQGAETNQSAKKESIPAINRQNNKGCNDGERIAHT